MGNLSKAHGEGHLAFTVTFRPAAATPSPTAVASPKPVASPSPHPGNLPLSPAAFAAVVIVLVVLGAGVLAVLRSRWQ
jgi:hypothetical protein